MTRPTILVPLTITDAMLTSCSIAEPDSGETAWVSAGTYALGDRRIRTTTHRVYECIQAHTGRTALPEADPLYWEDAAPTNRWAPFDTYTSTAATAATSLTYVLSPGFFDTVRLYGLQGSSLTLTLKDGPGGTVLRTETVSLSDDAQGLFEYLFAPFSARDKLGFTGLELHPSAELTIAITGTTARVGMIAVGQDRELVTDWGGTEYGASAEPYTYSRIKTDDYGETTIVRRHAATNLRLTLVLPQEAANLALRTVQQVLDVPVAFAATGHPGYEGLGAFGLITARLSYESVAHCRMNIDVKGMI